MPRLSSFAGVARAPFLLLPVTLVVSGVGAARWEGHFDIFHSIVALVGLLLLHVAVNVLNEVSDMRSGIDLETSRTPFSGGSGTLPSGALSVRAAAIFGWCGVAGGLLIGAWFTVRVGWGMVPIALVGALLVVGYTDFLARRGVGELGAGLGLGALPVVGVAYVQEGSIGAAPIAVAIPAFLMTFNLLLLNEFPDEEADRRGGRRNLVIIFGRRVAARVWAAAALLTPASIAVSVAAGALPAACLVAVLPSALLAKGWRWAFRSADREVPIPALGANVAWNLLTNFALGVALVAAGAWGSAPAG